MIYGSVAGVTAIVYYEGWIGKSMLTCQELALIVFSQTFF